MLRPFQSLSTWLRNHYLVWTSTYSDPVQQHYCHCHYSYCLRPHTITCRKLCQKRIKLALLTHKLCLRYDRFPSNYNYTTLRVTLFLAVWSDTCYPGKTLNGSFHQHSLTWQHAASAYQYDLSVTTWNTPTTRRGSYVIIIYLCSHEHDPSHSHVMNCKT